MSYKDWEVINSIFAEKDRKFEEIASRLEFITNRLQKLEIKTARIEKKEKSIAEETSE